MPTAPLIEYLATTTPAAAPPDRLVVMVDGTVPGWELRATDYHFDHHRTGGADIQIDEIRGPLADEVRARVREAGALFVTTLADADACAAAVICQREPDQSQRRRLRAIAYECDYLAVPSELSDLAEFAFRVVAALKLAAPRMILAAGLSSNRGLWSQGDRIRYGSAAFEYGTKQLLCAMDGVGPWPGENGEADQYAEMLEQDAKQLIEQARVCNHKGIAIADCRGLDRRMDPRACLIAWRKAGLLDTRAETLSVFDHKAGGTQYTLGSVPFHEGLRILDYTTGAFKRLTAAERKVDPDAGPWGGRRTVGGSAWNTPSLLSAEQVVDIVLGKRHDSQEQP